jgi:hypothetical protein
MEQLTRVISFEGTEKESYFCTSHVKDINWFL